MKKSLLFVFIWSVAISASAQKEFVITGKIEGIKDGSVISLFRNEGDLGKSILVDTVVNGVFNFKGVAESDPERMSIMGRSEDFPSMLRDVWVAPGARIKITGTGYLQCTWNVKSKLAEQREADRYIKASGSCLVQIQELSVEKNKLRTEWDEVSGDKRKMIIDSITTIDSISDILNEKKFLNDIKIMRKTPVSDIWMSSLRDLSKMAKYDKKFLYRKETEELYGRLTEEQKKSDAGVEIHTNLYPPKAVQPGEDMADGELYDWQGVSHRLSDYKGRYILLDFWSMGCGPCMAALPEMREMARSYGDKLAIISVSIDGKKAWTLFLKTEEMDWINLNDFKGRSGVAAKYGVEGIPCYVIITPEGKVSKVWTGYGKGSLKSELEKYIK